MEEQLIQPMMFWATTSVDDPNEVRSGAGSYIAAVQEVLTGAQESIDLIYEGAAAIPRACACVQCTRFVHGGTRFVHGGCVSCLAGCGRGCESRESWRMLRDRTARRGVACGATWLRVDASARDAVHDAGCPPCVSCRLRGLLPLHPPLLAICVPVRRSLPTRRLRRVLPVPLYRLFAATDAVAICSSPFDPLGTCPTLMNQPPTKATRRRRKRDGQD